MNKDLISAVEALEIEAGISKETMFDTIEKALREEYKAQYGNSKEESQDCRVVVDRETGDFHLFADIIAANIITKQKTECLALSS